MINNFRTFACVLCGLFIGGAFMVQAWGVLLVFFLLVLPYEYLGRATRKVIIEVARWIEERQRSQTTVQLNTGERVINADDVQEFFECGGKRG